MPIDSFRTRPRLFAFTVIAIAAAVVAAGLASRRSQAEQLQQQAAARSMPSVTLLTPTPGAAATLELPARIEPWARAPIYARVSGYLKQWKVDIGGSVRAGQLLAEIDTPELDQQLLQAKAELATARSNLILAVSTAQRWQALLASDSVSRQEADEKAGDLAAKQSVVNALQANVERVQALQHYTRLTAPFDGVVTARNTDVGALINVAGNTGSELFTVSDLRRLRVYVSVPQRQVGLIRIGTQARLSVPEHPGQSYAAIVRSRSQAINASTGSMLIQLSVDNADGELLPGGFATVRFASPPTTASASDAALSLPPGALIYSKNGIQVATVGPDNHVRLKRVTIARDLGNMIELASGIDRHERVIDSPPDGIANGDAVRIVEPQKAAP